MLGKNGVNRRRTYLLESLPVVGISPQRNGRGIPADEVNPPPQCRVIVRVPGDDLGIQSYTGEFLRRSPKRRSHVIPGIEEHFRSLGPEADDLPVQPRKSLNLILNDLLGNVTVCIPY